LEPNNSGVAWTTVFTASGSADSHGNAVEVGEGVDSESFGVGPRMHLPAAYGYRISFSSNFKFSDENKSDGVHISSAGGMFVAGPNAGIAIKLSDIELGKESVEGVIVVYGSARSPTFQTVSLENGGKFQRICPISLRIGR
jgi:hypothetical protein